MCLPNSLPISASQVNVELNRAANYPFDMLGVSELALAAQAGAPNSMSNFVGKCNQGLVETYSNYTTGGTSWSNVPIGNANSNRRLYIGIIAGNIGADPGNSPTLTVGGSSATLLGANTTGDGSGNATGAAWFSFNATGTTANIAASWSTYTNFGIIVIAAYGYTTFKGYEADGGTTGGSDGQVGSLLNTVNGGALIAVSTYTFSNSGVTWSQLQAQQTWSSLPGTGNSAHNGSLAWLTNITASQVWNVSPHPAGQGNYMSCWISLAP